MVRTRGGAGGPNTDGEERGAGGSNAGNEGPPPIVTWGTRKKRVARTEEEPHVQISAGDALLFEQFKAFIASGATGGNPEARETEDRQDKEKAVNISDDDTHQKKRKRKKKSHRRKPKSPSTTDSGSDCGSSSSEEQGTKKSRSIPALMERFQRMHPPRYSGKGGPDVAETWVRKVGRLLNSLRYSADDKVVLAELCLDDVASTWWEQVTKEKKRKYKRKGKIAPEYSWKEFTTLFRAKWVGSAASDSRIAEFEALTQGNMTVTDYEYQFEKLVQYVPHYKGREEAKTERFIRGLRPGLGMYLASHEFTTFSQAVQKAQKVEKMEQRSKAVPFQPQSGGKNSASQGPSKKAGKPSGADSYSDRGRGPPRDYPECQGCGKRHYGECYLRTNRCLTCGMIGHRAKDCPAASRAVGTVQPKPQQQGQYNGPRGQGTQQARPQKNPNAERVYTIERVADQEQATRALAGT